MTNKKHNMNQIGKRILALTLAAATVIGSWSIDWNSLDVRAAESDYEAGGARAYSEGGVIYGYYSNSSSVDYEKLSDVRFDIAELQGTTDYTVTITDGNTGASMASKTGIISAVGEVTVGFDNEVIIAPNGSINVEIAFSNVTAPIIVTRRAISTGEEMIFDVETMSTAPPSSVNISSCPTYLAVGQTGQIVASEDTYHRVISYTVTNANPSDCISVAADGTITANAAGTATITASTTYGDTATSSEITIVGVAYDSTSLPFNGSVQRPNATLTAGGNTLSPDSDYTVSGGGIDVGTYRLNIEGTGTYTGVSAGTDFDITAVDIAGVDVSTASYSIDTLTSEVTGITGVKLGSYNLTYGTDFTATAVRTGSQLVGSNYVYKYTVTLQAVENGNFTGTKAVTNVDQTATAGITLKDIYSIEIPEEAFLYVGATEDDIKDKIIVRDRNGNQVIDPGFDFTYSATNVPGTVTVKATYADYYSGDISTTFTLYGKIDENTPITLSGDSIGDNIWMYTGNAIVPNVTVTYNGNTLVEGTDYTVTPSNNVNVGPATVTVTGRGSYIGSKSATFTIVPNLQNATVKLGGNSVKGTKDNNFATGYKTTYDGDAKTTTTFVQLNGATLLENTDYTVAWSNNVDAGTATATITTKGTYGTQRIAATFTIEPASIAAENGGDITWITTNYVYDGNPKEPAAGLDLAVKLGSRPLATTDYTLSYSDNHTDAGTAWVIATGTGNYTGELMRGYTIKPKTIPTANTEVKFPDSSYTGANIEPRPTSVTVDGKTLVDGVDYASTITYTDNKNIGTATGTITGIGNYTGQASGTFQIKEKAIVGSQITYIINGHEIAHDTDLENNIYESNYSDTFNGYERHPSIRVMDGTTQLVLNRDYTVSWRNAINATEDGVKGAAAVITGKGNYANSGSVTIKYQVKKCPLNSARISDNRATFTAGDSSTVELIDSYRKSDTTRPNGKLKLYDATNAADGDYTVDWKDWDADPNHSAGANKTMIITGVGNYTGERVVTYNQGIDIGDPANSGQLRVYDYVTGTFDNDAAHVYADGLRQYDVTYWGATSMGDTLPRFTISAKQTLLQSGEYDVNLAVIQGNGYDAGSIVKVTATGKGEKYYGSLSAYYHIIPLQLSADKIALKFEDEANNSVANTDGKYVKSYDYNGEATITPVFTLTFEVKNIWDSNAVVKTNVLVEGTDYTYTPPTITTEIGQKTGTITAAGSNYTGTLEILYNVDKAIITDAMVSDISTQEYTGAEVKPEPVVTYKGKTLKEGRDYELFYDHNTAAGVDTATVTVKGKAPNYGGEVVKHFSIEKKKLNASNTKIVLASDAAVYTGNAIVLQDNAYTVIYNNKTKLTPGTDFNVTYENNTMPGKATMKLEQVDASKYEIEGDITANFNIYLDLNGDTNLYTVEGLNVGGTNELVYYGETTGWKYKGSGDVFSLDKDNNLSVRIKVGNSGFTLPVTSYAFQTSNLTEPTTAASITINGSGTNQFCDGKIEVRNIKVYIDVSLLKVEGLATVYPYTGYDEDGKPEPTIYYGSRRLNKGTEYSFSYTTPSAGDYHSVLVGASVNDKWRTISITGNTNHLFEGTAEIGKYQIKYDLSRAVPTSAWKNTFTYAEIKQEAGTGAVSAYRQVPVMQVSNKGVYETLNSSFYDVAYESSKGNGDAFNNAGATITATVNPKQEDYCYNSKTLSYTVTGIDVTNQLQITLEGQSFPYSGTAITPAVTSVTTNSGEPLGSSDYTVTYSNNVNVGTATVKVTASGNYQGSTTKTFTINPKSIDDPTVEMMDITVTYTGVDVTEEQLANMRLRDTSNGNILMNGTDFTISAPSGVNVTDEGRVTVTMKDGKNYEGTKEFKFTISPLDLRKGTLDVKGTSTEYTGQRVVPEVTVKIDGRELRLNQDYKVTYNGGQDMIEVGDYEMLIEPYSDDGNIIGSLRKTYYIIGRSIGTADFKLLHDTKHHYTMTFDEDGKDYNTELHYDYTGSPLTPAVTLLDEGYNNNQPLVKNVDYTVSYEDNTNATAEAKIIVEGIGNYSGKVVKTFTIGKDMSLGTMKLSSEVLSGLEYNGVPQKPRTITVKDKDGNVLVEGQDYTIIYPDDITNVGTKTVTAKAIGTSGYYGTKTADYEITQKDVTNPTWVKIVPNLSKDKNGIYYTDYTGAEIRPTVEVYVDNNGNGTFTDTEKLATTDYDVAYNNNVDAGSNAMISVTLKGNYVTKTITQAFRINGSELSEDATTIVVNDRSYTYTGSEITPNLSVYQDLTNGNRVELVLGTDYTIASIKDNINPGDGEVTIQGLGSFSGKLSTTFTICADFSTAFAIDADDDGTMDNTCKVPTQLYVGDNLTPVAEVMIGGKELVANTDFVVGSVTFTAYDSDNNPTAGKVDITGNNKYYKNTYTANFEVTTDLSQVELEYRGLDDVIYNGTAQRQENFKIYDPSGNEVRYDPTKVTYVNSSDGEACVNAGTVTVTIPITIGTISGKTTTTYLIKKANIAAAAYTGGANSTYTGKLLQPPVTLKYRGTTLQPNVDYSIVYDNNRKPTSKTSTGVTPAPATITITGMGNFEGSYYQEFQIYPERMRGVDAEATGPNSVVVSWDKLNYVTGYRVDVMSTASAVPVKTVTVSNPNATSTEITGLSEGTSYSFRAYSYVTVEGTTYYGLLNSKTVATGISTPSITASSTKSKEATLRWIATTSGVKYMIYRSTTANGKYELVAITKTDATSFTDVGLTRGKTYYYKTRAFRYPDQYGEYSTATAVTVK